MNSFLQIFKSEKLPEWEDFYFDLEKVIELVANIKERKNQFQFSQINLEISLNSSKNINDFYNSNNDLLIEMISLKDFIISELNKVYIFYSENIIYYKRRINKISEQLNFIKENPWKQYSDQKLSLEQAIKELYKENHFLNQYVYLNYNCEKTVLLKLHEYCKVLFNKEDYQKLFEELDKYSLEPLTSNSTRSELTMEINKTFMTHFYDKYKNQTKNILFQLINNKSGISSTQAFIIGIFLGVLMFVIITCYLICYYYGIDIDDDKEFNALFPIFRAQIVLCVFMWFYAFNIYLWDTYGINFRKIFGFENHYSNFLILIKRAAIFTTIVSISILYYLIIRTKVLLFMQFFHIIPLKYIPLIGLLCFYIYLLWPIPRMFNYEGRKWLLLNLFESIFFISITFSATWIVDDIRSINGVIRDTIYSICFYTYYNEESYNKNEYQCNSISTPVVLSGIVPPFAIATLQFLKSLTKTEDYFTSAIFILGIFFNISTLVMAFSIKADPNYKYIWFISAIWNTLYNFYWDSKLVFGLFQLNSHNFLLRDKLSLKKKWIYYFFLVFDFFGRCLWVLLISPTVVYSLIMRSEFVFFVLYVGEAIRKSIQNFLTIEYIHIQNCSSFRVTHYIELPFYKKDNKFFVKDQDYKKKKKNIINENLNITRDSFKNASFALNNKTLDESIDIEVDKLKIRLDKILKETFFNRNKWINNKDFIKRIHMAWMKIQNDVLKTTNKIKNEKLPIKSNSQKTIITKDNNISQANFFQAKKNKKNYTHSPNLDNSPNELYHSNKETPKKILKNTESNISENSEDISDSENVIKNSN